MAALRCRLSCIRPHVLLDAQFHIIKLRGRLHQTSLRLSARLYFFLLRLKSCVASIITAGSRSGGAGDELAEIAYLVACLQ